MGKFSKRQKAYLITAGVFAAAFILLSILNITYSSDEVANTLIKGCVLRATAIGAIVFSSFVYCPKNMADIRNNRGWRSLLWCLPCLAVAIVNFPFSALISGSATITRPDLIWLFIIYCIIIGIFEEFLFRGILQTAFATLFEGKKLNNFLTVLVTSLCFGLWHLFNLFEGAGIGAVLLQTGYSFLIGAMLSAVILRTGNLWICVFLHALFDCGGMIVTMLGEGTFQDTVFWILTAVFGVICLAHVLYFLLKQPPRPKIVK